MSTDVYFSRPEVSNSDLIELKNYFLGDKIKGEREVAFANGTLIDAMITEPEKVDYLRYRVAGEDYQYSFEEFERAKEMKKAFFKDQFCRQMVSQCTFQKVIAIKKFRVQYHPNYSFYLPMRCKFDLYCDAFDLSGDIKSTTAVNQKQAEEAVRHFDYDQSRALYMDLAARNDPRRGNNDIIIFISKVNYKIFKIPVKRDSELYKIGREKYADLAFKWHYLFGEL
jgi:hypothetical protein